MAKFCLTKELADSLHAAAKRGEIDLVAMYDMNSSQRTEIFQKYVDKATAQKINGGFEEAMISDQQTALKNWAKSVFSGSDKANGRKKDVFDKIDRLNELGVLNPANEDSFLSDLVATKLGVTVKADEAARISELAEKVSALAEQESEFGTPSIEYFKAKKEAEDYLKSLTPSSRLKVTTSISGRGAMLLSVKSPFLNIESNSIQAFLGAAERRLSGIVDVKGKQVRLSNNFIGANTEYSKQYFKFVNKVFQETGYDITRMRTLDSITKVRGEEIGTHTEGAGKARKVGKFYEDVVFKQLMSAPDVAFSAVHFADSANLASTRIAKDTGLKGEQMKAKALEIFKDATRIEPKTEAGKKVRSQAIADAEYGTYTNDSTLSRVALGIREVVNIATGDFRLGDQLLPFVKTPANVLNVGLDVSGVLLPIDTAVRTAKIVNAIREGESLKEATLNNIDGMARKWIRAGMGLTLAHIIASLFDPEDFIGEYPTSDKERELLKARNATTNSVKVGNKWISLDYFGALGSPLVGLLNAKKYGTTGSEKLFNYYVGVGKQLTKLPGLDLVGDTYESLRRTKFNTLDENVGELEKGFTDYVSARTIPAILYDFAKITDEYERQADPDKPLTAVQKKIPILNQQLPPQISVFGDKVKTENGLSILLFGSRVKTQVRSDIVNEMIRLDETGNLPSITDSTETSTRMKALKEQIGDKKFEEATDYFRNEYAAAVEKKISSFSYKRKSDEEKAKLLDDVKQSVLEQTLRKYKYKKPKR